MSDIHAFLNQRWSPRAFAETVPDEDTLRTLFEAARWAPSCYNGQPWSFVVTRRDRAPGYPALFDTLVPANQAWAATAPVLLLAVAAERFAHNGQPNRHAWYDLGLAMGNFLAQATALGLVAHQMAGFDAARAAAALAIPDDHSAVAVVALGYLGEPARLPAGTEEKDPRARERKGQAEFVFNDRWGVAL